MAKIDTFISFVKDQVGVQDKLAKKYEDDDYRKRLHLKTRKSFSELASFLEEIKSKGTENVAYINRGTSPQKRILLTYEDIVNAPDELLKELNIGDADRQELIIEYIIAQEGGILSLDKIMVALFKWGGEVPKRAAVTQRLYRMASRGMIYNVPGKKGVYSTYELTEHEAQKIFGPDSDSDSPPSPATNLVAHTGGPQRRSN
jgi:hypothetical protein